MNRKDIRDFYWLAYFALLIASLVYVGRIVAKCYPARARAFCNAVGQDHRIVGARIDRVTQFEMNPWGPMLMSTINVRTTGDTSQSLAISIATQYDTTVVRAPIYYAVRYVEIELVARGKLVSYGFLYSTYGTKINL